MLTSVKDALVRAENFVKGDIRHLQDEVLAEVRAAIADVEGLLNPPPAVDAAPEAEQIVAKVADTTEAT